MNENLNQGEKPAGEESQPIENPIAAEPENSPVAEEPASEPVVETPAVVEIPADEAAAPEVEPIAATPAAGDKKWYVIQTLTGQEDRVKQALELTIRQQNLQDRVAQVLVPTEETVEIKGGKRVEKVKKMYPGYVFLEMFLDEQVWYEIRQTPGVARFIGTKVRPTPVSGREMQRVLKQLGKEGKLLEIAFEKGEGVRVISGPFRGYTGTIDEVNAEKGKLKILINIFGRDTPVEVNVEHAQKIV